jgi:hypothetical protein
MQELMQECNLINLYKSFHNDYEEFATHANGSKTIDFILGSPNIIQYINRIGYIELKS